MAAAHDKTAELRSDCRVELTLASTGGISINLQSKVEAYYGASIRAQVAETLAKLGVEHARVVIRDAGALPFVIQARVEAAVLAVGKRPEGDGRPAGLAASFEPSSAARLRRSRLYVPGNEPKFMINAGLHGADGVILDLEDSVHPRAKDAARLVVRNALRSVDFAGAERMVRINQLPIGSTDLDAIVPEQPDLILVPKAESAAQVVQVDEAIARIQQTLDNARPIWLMPIVESALGVENAFEIASASERVVALTIGLEDYTADLGVPKTPHGAESAWARARIVNAAGAAGVQPIDSVFADFGNLDGLRAWAERSRALGFEGMGCIHPSQIRVIHDAFAPSSKELATAQEIVAAFEEAERAGLAVVSLGAKMIDPPVVERARRLVRRAAAIGLVSTESAG